MIVLAWVLGIVAYFGIGIGGVMVALRLGWDENDPEFMVPMAIAFWPLFGIMGACGWIGERVVRASTRLVELASPKPEVVRELPTEDDINWTPPPDAIGRS